MCTLTPTVRLNSFAMTRQIAPVYVEVPENDTSPESPKEQKQRTSKRDYLFKFRLLFEGIEVEGSAKTKQNAKHNAAQKMIELLKPKYPKYFAVKETLDAEEKMLKMLGDKKLTPIYQYIREEGSSENRIYTVNCTINSHVLEGRGRGKKNARLDVAEKVLKYFKDHESVSETDQAETIDEKSENPDEKAVVERLENCLFTDPVSVLQEYLVHNNLDPPSYTSHISDKIYSITCKAGGISYNASAKNKKLAKQCSAAGVIDILGVKERPKKKPKKKGSRNQRYHFRYPAPLNHRQFGFEGMLTRPKLYEPSQRAINFSRRNPVQHYYDMF
ncbi:hypothetical protein ACHWQZ_G018514 [Mnemiopsis leidyi]